MSSANRMRSTSTASKSSTAAASWSPISCCTNGAGHHGDVTTLFWQLGFDPETVLEYRFHLGRQPRG